MNPNALKDAFERLQSELKWKAPELHGDLIAECYVAVAKELSTLLDDREQLAARVLELQREIGERNLRDAREADAIAREATAIVRAATVLVRAARLKLQDKSDG